MTTVTRERLTKILIETMALIKQRSSCTGDSSGISTEVNAELFAEIARMALASLDAEPVAWIDEQELRDVEKDGLGYMFTVNPIVPGADPCRVIRLYAEPPAPVMPEECPAELPYAQVKAVADLFALCWRSGEVVTYTPDPEKATIWINNYSGTCVQEYVKLERLQEALAGNSPVTPDGWISCSERMPEDEQEVIVHNKLGYRYVSYFDEHSGLFFDMRGGNQMNCIEHILVTHWRPMPAAPKPEQS